MNIISSLLNWIGNTIGANPNTLTTTSKTLVGAINENASDISDVSTIQSGTLKASDWAASNASFTSGSWQKIGKIVNIDLTLKMTTAITANNEGTLGTLTNSNFTLNTKFFGVHVFGTVTAQNTGIIRTAPAKNLPVDSNVYVKMIGITS